VDFAIDHILNRTIGYNLEEFSLDFSKRKTTMTQEEIENDIEGLVKIMVEGASSRMAFSTYIENKFNRGNKAKVLNDRILLKIFNKACGRASRIISNGVLNGTLIRTTKEDPFVFRNGEDLLTINRNELSEKDFMRLVYDSVFEATGSNSKALAETIRYCGIIDLNPKNEKYCHLLEIHRGEKYDSDLESGSS
tara:strand:- start:302 stop:880 length:579 start_codon:yes stop_codon:yes gene_type:complete